MEKGTVEAVNERRGMFAVRCEQGGYAVFELVSWIEVKRGDLLEWSKRELGRMTLTNLSQEKNALPVYAQNWDCSREVATHQIA
jgi:hypothetical protein